MRQLIAATAAFAVAASAAMAAPVKLTDQQLDAIVAGSGCTVECIPEDFFKGNNGWGNGADGSNNGSDHGKTAQSKTANFNVPDADTVNINPTTSSGR